MSNPSNPLATAPSTAPPTAPSVAPPTTPATPIPGVTATNVPTFMPPTPIMGGIIQTTDKDFIPWTGGRPLVDWTGLDPTARTTPKSPNQQRPVSSSAAQKGHIYRQTGISTKKLSRADLDLPHFEERVWRHFCDSGLDTVAYVPNPIGSTEMINVIQEHDRFTVDSVIKLVAAQVKKYDDYDIQSDDEATEFLKESLDFDLAKELRDVHRPEDVFPVTFMRLIHLIRSTSSERYAKIKLRLQNRKPSQYPGQNLTMMASDMRADAKILETARQYEHSLTQLILDNFLEAGGANNEDFRYPLRAIKVRLDAAILAIGYLDRDAAIQHMTSEKLTYRDICDAAAEGYRNQSDSARGWPPARGVQDSRAPPKVYGNAAIATVDPSTLAHAYALLQTTAGAGGKAKPTDVCMNCGKTGHWARDCPQKKTEKKTSGPKTRFRSSRPGAHHGRQASRQRPPRPEDGWKTIAPAPGQPTTKTADGKSYHWCSKCVRWTPTHTTATHKGPDKSTGAPPLQANFAFDSPAAWHAGIYPVPSFWTWWYLLCDLMHMLATSLNNRLALIIFASCLGWTLGKLPSGFWIFAWRFLTMHWSTFLPVIGWLLCLVVAFLGPSLFNRAPLDLFGRPLMKAWVPLGPIRQKQFNRRARAENHTSCRRRRSSSPAQRPRHLGLKAKAAQRPSLDDRHLLPLTAAISNLQDFAASISISRPGREGDNRSNIREQPPKRKHKRYRPPTISTTASPPRTRQPVTPSPPRQAWALFTNVEMPENLQLTAARISSAVRSAYSYIAQPEETYPVIWDSGASLSITPHKSDFVGPLDSTSIGVKIQGIAKGLVIQGVGQVAWSFSDSDGLTRTLLVPAYYVPKATVRLLSTNSLLQTYPTETIQILHNKMVLSGCKINSTSAIEVLVDPRSNLHIGAAKKTISITSQDPNAYITTTSLHNQNLNAAEKELLRWHCRLGHLHSKKIQFLMQSGVLAHSETARRLQTSSAKLTSCPMCAACQYGKQRRTASPGRRISTVRERDGALKQDDLFPGQKVSVDHFVCSTRGRLPNTYGKEDPKLQYSGGAIFVDHATGYTYIHHQVSLTTHSTIESKEQFESFCRDHGVIVSEYLSDNGTAFTANAYREHLRTFSQTSRFAGVGAHHHNGVAERAIQTIMSIARTMMLHSAIHWPDVADAALWPLAVDHAVRLFNLMPNPDNGLSPHDLFTKTRWRQSEFQNFHVWGCPVYVLDKTISDGKKLPRWKPRSSRQFYVGMSKKHASSVPLCLNLDTGAITPQFHVVFDEDFATVASTPADLPVFDTPAWHSLFGDSVYQYVLDDDDQATQDRQLDDDGPPPQMETVLDAFEQHRPTQPLPTPPPAQTTPLPPMVAPQTPAVRPVELPLNQPEAVARNDPRPMPPSPQRLSPIFEDMPPAGSPLQRENQGASQSPASILPPQPIKQREQAPVPQQRELPPPPSPRPNPTRRSPPPTPIAPSRPKRVSFAPKRYGFDGTQGHGYMSTSYENDPLQLHQDLYGYSPTLHAFLTSITSNASNIPEIYKARAVKDPDTLSYEEAMRSPQKDKWLEVAQTEISGLESKHTWKEVPMDQAKSKIIPGTWVFRVKRSPSGEIRKFKARYCVRGDLEEDNGDDNYASVVAWSTVRLFLVLCFVLGWTTSSIDFTNAFVQSVLDSPIWIHIPRGFTSALGPGTCLQLGRSLYGLRRSPKLFYETAIDAFLKLGFKQSKFDPCFLHKPGMLIVMYVDDCGIGAADPADIDKLVADLRKMGFELTQEGDFSEFLGIKMTKQKDGTIELTQSGLIDKIIKATALEECRPNYTPATGPLGSDPDGPPMSETWSYPSIIGMLLYLSTNTRPDIAFAVSQVARFSSKPKQVHSTAIKTLIRYLKRTRDKGMILKPTGTLNLELYVDADF